MIPNYKRPKYREYITDVLERPLDDQDLDMISYIEGLEKENKQIKDRHYRAIHLIQLLQMDGEVVISDLSKIVDELQREEILGRYDNRLYCPRNKDTGEYIDERYNPTDDISEAIGWRTPEDCKKDIATLDEPEMWKVVEKIITMVIVEK